ncbi:ECF transporter S component [Clostridium fallax]|uniref:Uncharacterized membrane protein n=1 Tax=Clostridium fallax TaxID=1533 RepID=A0A1M4W3K6_9CLOT|nr:ECF transporter S component [Clostridium fallax]SHE75693.1 Uncharacterized membrane protein [Clostridium fallax]SQB22857.1 membrane spanning protein [Clostridium fallax]
MKVKRLVRIGLFAALCFIGTYIHIPIVFGGYNSMIHLGTTMIFLSAILLGPDAGISAGIGCALFDAMDPKFAAYIIPTLIIKGLTGYVAGKIAFYHNNNGNNNKLNILAFISGGLVSLFGYFIANWIFFKGWIGAVLGLSTSIITTIIGVLITIPLAIIIKPLVIRSGVQLFNGGR